jgi:hypothetical protein
MSSRENAMVKLGKSRDIERSSFSLAMSIEEVSLRLLKQKEVATKRVGVWRVEMVQR